MSREVIGPVDALVLHVRHVMAGGFDAPFVCLPACADVQLLFYERGGATLVHPDGGETPLPPVFLVGAVTHPRRYRVAPDSRFVAITFRPGGVHACLGISAAALTGTITALASGERMLHGLGAAPVQAVQSWLVRMRETVGAAGRPLPAMTWRRWQEPVTALAAHAGISVRQFERRCLTHFGMSLREYRRLARYSAAMVGLMTEGAAPQALAALAQDAGYVDQAHFTRDFTALVGQSPGRFLKQRAGAETRLWQFTQDELAHYLS